jgi:hypothetical protein
MGRVYIKPELASQVVQLGVFGNYGGGDGGDGGSVPTPIRIIERFQLHMD